MILRINDVKKILGYKSNTTIYNLIKDGLITPPVSISFRLKGWPDYEIFKIEKARIAEFSENDIKSLVSELKNNRLIISIL